MAIWNNYVNALFKLKLFTGGGCIFWTILAFVISSFNWAMEYVYNSQAQPFLMMKLIMIAEGGLVIIIMVSIPKSILDLSQCAEEEKNDDLAAPSKLALALGLSCVIVICVAGWYTVFGDPGLFYLVIVNFFFSLNLLALGLLIGTLTNTLSKRCRQIENHGVVFKEATILLEKYQALNEGCKFGLFPLFTCSVLNVIMLIYLFIIIMVFHCLDVYKIPVALMFIAAKVGVYTLNLLHLGWTLDNCFENIKRVSVPLR